MDTGTVLTLVIAVGALIVALASAYFSYQQVKVARHTSEAQNLIALIDHLQRDDVRKARALVLGDLAAKPYSAWTEDERRTASLVPSSYEVAGILVRSQLVVKETFIGSYGPSIIKCYEVCSPLIEDYRRHMSDGTQFKYMDNFEWLFHVARATPVHDQLRFP